MNQPRFREANERLHEAVESEGQEAQAVPFLCECADDDCPGTVNVSLGEWEAVVSRNNHFLMEAGHQHSEGEEVVGSLGQYEIARSLIERALEVQDELIADRGEGARAL